MLYVICWSAIALPLISSHYGVKADFSLDLEHVDSMLEVVMNQAIIPWLLLRHSHKIMLTHILLAEVSHMATLDTGKWKYYIGQNAYGKTQTSNGKT